MPLGPNELLGPRDIMLCSFVLLKQKKVLRCLLFRKSLKYLCEGSAFFFFGGGGGGGGWQQLKVVIKTV